MTEKYRLIELDRKTASISHTEKICNEKQPDPNREHHKTGGYPPGIEICRQVRQATGSGLISACSDTQASLQADTVHCPGGIT